MLKLNVKDDEEFDTRGGVIRLLRVSTAEYTALHQREENDVKYLHDFLQKPSDVRLIEVFNRIIPSALTTACQPPRQIALLEYFSRTDVVLDVFRWVTEPPSESKADDSYGEYKIPYMATEIIRNVYCGQDLPAKYQYGPPAFDAPDLMWARTFFGFVWRDPPVDEVKLVLVRKVVESLQRAGVLCYDITDAISDIKTNQSSVPERFIEQLTCAQIKDSLLMLMHSGRADRTCTCKLTYALQTALLKQLMERSHPTTDLQSSQLEFKVQLLLEIVMGLRMGAFYVVEGGREVATHWAQDPQTASGVWTRDQPEEEVLMLRVHLFAVMLADSAVIPSLVSKSFDDFFYWWEDPAAVHVSMPAVPLLRVLTSLLEVCREPVQGIADLQSFLTLPGQAPPNPDNPTADRKEPFENSVKERLVEALLSAFEVNMKRLLHDLHQKKDQSSRLDGRKAILAMEFADFVHSCMKLGDDRVDATLIQGSVGKLLLALLESHPTCSPLHLKVVRALKYAVLDSRSSTLYPVPSENTKKNGIDVSHDAASGSTVSESKNKRQNTEDQSSGGILREAFFSGDCNLLDSIANGLTMEGERKDVRAHYDNLGHSIALCVLNPKTPGQNYVQQKAYAHERFAALMEEDLNLDARSSFQKDSAIIPTSFGSLDNVVQGPTTTGASARRDSFDEKIPSPKPQRRQSGPSKLLSMLLGAPETIEHSQIIEKTRDAAGVVITEDEISGYLFRQSGNEWQKYYVVFQMSKQRMLMYTNSDRRSLKKSIAATGVVEWISFGANDTDPSAGVHGFQIFGNKETFSFVVSSRDDRLMWMANVRGSLGLNQADDSSSSKRKPMDEEDVADARPMPRDSLDIYMVDSAVDELRGMGLVLPSFDTGDSGDGMTDGRISSDNADLQEADRREISTEEDGTRTAL